MKLYNYPIGAMLTSFLESETPRIKADAVREFIAEVEKKMLENENITSVLGLAADLSLIMRKVSKTRTNSTEIEGDINQ